MKPLKSLPKIHNSRKYLYVCIDKQRKEAYIGITCNPKERIRGHLKGIHKYFFKKNLNNFFSCGKIFTNFNAKKEEEKKINYYKKNNYKVINIAKAGSIGGGILKWDKKACLADAKKYKSKMEWYNNSSGAYSAAKRNGWIKICCQHMISNRKPDGYWTFERCLKDAKKYNTIKDWNEHSISAYTIAKRNGWLKECTIHMTRLLKPRGYWTKQRCKQDAKKYNTIKEWTEHSVSAYSIAKKNGWLKECTLHMKRVERIEKKPELNSKIKVLFLKGYSQHKIAEELSCNRITVRKKILKMGLNTQPI